jgi:O-antigen ligase
VLVRLLPLPLLLAALAVSYSRNAWLGYTAGLLVTIGIVRPKLLWLAPVIVVGLVAIAPQAVRERVYSVLDYKTDVSSRERIYMAQAGFRMVAAHPIFGVGPEMVPSRYADFRSQDSLNYKPSHLHSNMMQIAAERGLPALLAWFAILGFCARDMLPLLKEKNQYASALGALAAIVALLVAGLFEYNFGDSEVKMLFLCVLSLPYARSEQDA